MWFNLVLLVFRLDSYVKQRNSCALVFENSYTAAWPAMLTEKNLTPAKSKKALIKTSRDFMQIP